MLRRSHTSIARSITTAALAACALAYGGIAKTRQTLENKNNFEWPEYPGNIAAAASARFGHPAYTTQFNGPIGTAIPAPSAVTAGSASLNTVIDAGAPPYNAVCDGVADSSTAINAAAAAAAAGDFLLQLPQGICRIIRPLVFAQASGQAPMVVGHDTGSVILADYSAWVGSDYNAVEINYADAVSVLEPRANQQFRHFIIEGENNSSLRSTVGLAIHTTAATVSEAGAEAGYSSYRTLFKNIEVYRFDTCIAPSEIINSTFENVSVSSCRIGVNASGYLINDTFNGLDADFGSTSYTSTTGTTTGFLLGSKTYNLTGGRPDPQYPQGIVLANSKILNYGIDLDIEAGLFIDIHDSMIDFAQTSPAIKIYNPTSLQIHNNYIYVKVPGDAVQVAAPAGGNVGLWITDNFISCSSTGSQKGIDFISGSQSWNEFHVKGNAIGYCSNPIYVGQNAGGGEISFNNGFKNTGTFIDISTATLGGVVIDGNRTLDDQNILNPGSNTAANIVTGQNQSATQATGLLYGVGASFGGMSSAPAMTVGNPLGKSNVAFSTGAGTNPSGLTISGIDSSFLISFTTGASPAATSGVFVLTFNSARGHVAYCEAQPANASTAALAAAQTPWVSSFSATSMTLSSNSSALAASTIYSWAIACP